MYEKFPLITFERSPVSLSERTIGLNYKYEIRPSFHVVKILEQSDIAKLKFNATS